LPTCEPLIEKEQSQGRRGRRCSGDCDKSAGELACLFLHHHPHRVRNRDADPILSSHARHRASRADTKTVSVALLSAYGAKDISWGTLGALAHFSTLPIVAMMIVLNRNFVQGLTQGVD
jgi:hypothetical protein